MKRTLIFATGATVEEAKEAAEQQIKDSLRGEGVLLLEASNRPIDKVIDGSVVLIHLQGEKGKVYVADERYTQYIYIIANNLELIRKVQATLEGRGRSVDVLTGKGGKLEKPDAVIIPYQGSLGEGVRMVRYDSDSSYDWILPTQFKEPA